MRPHLAIHCRCNDHGCGGGEAGGGHHVSSETARHGADPLCGCRRDQDRIGGVGCNDVTDTAVGEQVEEIGINGVPCKCAQGEG